MQTESSATNIIMEFYKTLLKRKLRKIDIKFTKTKRILL
jgi:hypothetical protein